MTGIKSLNFLFIVSASHEAKKVRICDFMLDYTVYRMKETKTVHQLKNHQDI